MHSRPSYPDWPSGPGLPRDGDEIDGQYVLGSLLGIGGMGAVFEAEDRGTGGRVAIKVLRPEETETHDATRRFMREARAASTIQNPHVVRVLGMGKLDNALPYMVLELLEGDRLDTIIRNVAPVPVPLAVDYVLQACEGLAAAHALGFIHRDLKPSNLFLARGADGSERVKVLDFGIAKATGRLDPNVDGLSLTETSSTLGSPQYMSPEQVRCSKSVDTRTDIWPLGLILHKLLTGRAAFEADSVGAQFAMIVTDPPTPLRAHRPDLPVVLEAVVTCCLEKHPDRRYQDVAQVAEALAPFGAGGAKDRIARIRQILDRAGASSPALPTLGSRDSMPGASRDSVPGAVSPEDHVTQAWRRGESAGTARSWDASQAAGRARLRSGRMWLFGGAAALALAALGTVGWVLSASSPGDPSAAGVPTVGATPSAGDTSLAVSEPGASSVRIDLDINPPDAQVLLDGALTRNDPITLPKSDRVHEIVIKAPGYVAERREVSAAHDADLAVALTRDQAAAATAEAAASEPTARPTRPIPATRPGSAPKSGKSDPAQITPKGPWTDDL